MEPMTPEDFIRRDLEALRPLSLRDTFAAAALTGVIIQMRPNEAWTPEMAASYAYDYADAMLAARLKPNG